MVTVGALSIERCSEEAADANKQDQPEEEKKHPLDQ